MINRRDAIIAATAGIAGIAAGTPAAYEPLTPQRAAFLADVLYRTFKEKDLHNELAILAIARLRHPDKNLHLRRAIGQPCAFAICDDQNVHAYFDVFESCLGWELVDRMDDDLCVPITKRLNMVMA